MRTPWRVTLQRRCRRSRRTDISTAPHAGHPRRLSHEDRRVGRHATTVLTPPPHERERRSTFGGVWSEQIHVCTIDTIWRLAASGTRPSPPCAIAVGTKLRGRISGGPPSSVRLTCPSRWNGLRAGRVPRSGKSGRPCGTFWPCTICKRPESREVRGLQGSGRGWNSLPSLCSPARPPRSRMVVSVETLKRKGCATRGGKAEGDAVPSSCSLTDFW